MKRSAAWIFLSMLSAAGLLSSTSKADPCLHKRPPALWTVESSYPFVAGSERAYSEFYHGLWRTRVALTVYAAPRSAKVTGRINKHQLVQAKVGQTLVVHPMRFIAGKNFRAVDTRGKGVTFVRVPEGEPFWVLDSGGEGAFAIWWHCRILVWDSTEPMVTDPGLLDRLGSNEERWIRVTTSSGIAGWIKDVPAEGGSKLEPASATNKATGE